MYLSYWRLKRNISQEDLAKMIGKSLSTIRAYEKGRANPPQVTMENLCQVLQISKDDLLYNDKEDENEKRLTLREQLMQQGKI